MTIADVRFDVCVVGAGVSGLVAAWELRKRGRRVVVVEASAAPGGVIASRREDGFLYETGANSTLDTTPLIDRLLGEIGIRGERVDASSVAGRRYVVRNGRLVALPTSPLALLTTRAFTLSAKLRVLREPFIAGAAADAEESIAGFVRRRLGSEFLDYAIDPFVSGVYAGDPERISVRAAFPRLYALEREHGSLIRGQIAGVRARRTNPETSKNLAKSFSFRNGMQSLPAALARGLPDARFGLEVASIEAGERVQRVGGAGFSVEAAAVVLAVPAYTAARLVEPLSPAAARELAAIAYAPVAIVANGYRRSDVGHDLRGFGFLVPRVERRAILGSLFSSSLFDNRAPADHVLTTSFVGGLRDPDVALLEEGRIAALTERELEALVDARSPVFTRVVRWPKAIPQYTLGHLERIAAIDRALGSVPALAFCANWRGGVAVGDCIKSGCEAAERVDRFLASRAKR